MKPSQLRELAFAPPGTTEDMPFDEETIVYKVVGKLFVLLSLEYHPARITVKCDPKLALELRARFPDTIQPGYHMNKKHWITVDQSGTYPPGFMEERIRHSYDRVVQGLNQNQRAQIHA